MQAEYGRVPRHFWINAISTARDARSWPVAAGGTLDYCRTGRQLTTQNSRGCEEDSTYDTRRRTECPICLLTSYDGQGSPGGKGLV